jgi:hypothetical protein
MSEQNADNCFFLLDRCGTIAEQNAVTFALERIGQALQPVGKSDLDQESRL